MDNIINSSNNNSNNNNNNSGILELLHKISNDINNLQISVNNIKYKMELDQSEKDKLKGDIVLLQDKLNKSRWF